MVTPVPRSSAVSRVADVLEVVASVGAAGLTEIADRAGCAKSSTSDIVMTLVGEGMLSRGESGEYRLAPGIEEVAQAMTPAYDLADDFARQVGRVADLRGSTVFIGGLCAGEMVCLDVRLGGEPLAETPRAGLRVPLVASAAGSALLRALSSEDLQTHIQTFRGQRHLDETGIATLLARHVEERGADPLRSADQTVVAPSDSGDVEVAHPIVDSQQDSVCSVVVVRLAANGTPGNLRRARLGARVLAQMLSQ